MASRSLANRDGLGRYLAGLKPTRITQATTDYMNFSRLMRARGIREERAEFMGETSPRALSRKAPLKPHMRHGTTMGARHANRARTQHVRKLNNENKEGSISATPADAGGSAGGGAGTFRVSFLISASGGRCTRRCNDRSDRYAILTER